MPGTAVHLPRGPPVGALLPRPIVAPFTYDLKVATSLVLTGDLTPGGSSLAGVTFIFGCLGERPAGVLSSGYVTTNQGSAPEGAPKSPQVNSFAN